MRVLFLGDVVGTPGVEGVRRALPGIVASEAIDLVVANGENAANGGSGITPRLYRQLRHAGVDVVTLGDHVYKKLEIESVLADEAEPICRPANYPPSAIGKRVAYATARDGTPVAVFCVQGRTFMRSADCPFRAADEVLASIGDRARVVIVDVHAEATADKYLLAHHLDGRVSAIFGTHTHVQTADEQILAGGTAFVCDVGMTGPHASVLGRRVDRVLETARTFRPTAFDVASGDVRLMGAIADVDVATTRALAIRRFRHGVEQQIDQGSRQ